MIHTGELFVVINNKNEEDIKTKEMFNTIKVYSSDAFRIVWRKTRIGNYNEDRLHIYVDFIELLKKPDIEVNDVDTIVNKIRNTVESILGYDDFELVLSRLDYRYDVIIPDKNERKMIIKLLKKSAVKFNYMRKISKYDNSIRYFSKSRSDNIYDKEIERVAKKKEIKLYERDVLRFEAQLKYEHIKYKQRNCNLDKSLEAYLTYDMYMDYMQKMIINVVGTGDFYSLREAEKIIKISNIAEKEKMELREFLVYTSQKRNITKTKEKFKKYKFNKYINYLNELGINPIIIPEKVGVKFIRNPLRKLIDEFVVYSDNSNRGVNT